MPQDIGHLLERGAARQQAAGHSVAQQVRSGVGQTGPGISLADCLAYQIGADRLAARCDGAHEYRAVGGLRAFELQVVGNGMTGRHRQGQNVVAAALSFAQRDGAVAPVDVVESEPGCVFR